MFMLATGAGMPPEGSPEQYLTRDAGFGFSTRPCASALPVVTLRSVGRRALPCSARSAGRRRTARAGRPRSGGASRPAGSRAAVPTSCSRRSRRRCRRDVDAAEAVDRGADHPLQVPFVGQVGDDRDRLVVRASISLTVCPMVPGSSPPTPRPCARSPPAARGARRARGRALPIPRLQPLTIATLPARPARSAVPRARRGQRAARNVDVVDPAESWSVEQGEVSRQQAMASGLGGNSRDVLSNWLCGCSGQYAAEAGLRLVGCERRPRRGSWARAA